MDSCRHFWHKTHCLRCGERSLRSYEPFDPGLGYTSDRQGPPLSIPESVLLFLMCGRLTLKEMLAFSESWPEWKRWLLAAISASSAWVVAATISAILKHVFGLPLLGEFVVGVLSWHLVVRWGGTAAPRKNRATAIALALLPTMMLAIQVLDMPVQDYGLGMRVLAIIAAETAVFFVPDFYAATDLGKALPHGWAREMLAHGNARA
jgi:hypothetical protein